MTQQIDDTLQTRTDESTAKANGAPPAQLITENLAPPARTGVSAGEPRPTATATRPAAKPRRQPSPRKRAAAKPAKPSAANSARSPAVVQRAKSTRPARTRASTAAAAVVTGESLPTAVGEVVGDVTKLRDKYRKRAGWSQRFFRITGVAVIVLSTALPAAVIPEYGAKSFLVAIVGVLIALIAGLRTFFQWDRLWSLLRQTDFEITYLLDKWKLEVEGAKALAEADRAKKLNELTRALRDGVEKVRRSESSRFFSRLQFPHSSK